MLGLAPVSNANTPIPVDKKMQPSYIQPEVK